MSTISHYEILDKLGEGGMGVVWKARDTRLERFVALKLLPANKTADPARRQRFVQEARAASALNHPHIVTIYEIDRADDADFIAMEYIAGKTLDQIIPKKGLRVSEALRYAIQIADALAAAHAEGIVHRDLKPGNVVVSEKGVAKVLDFGLAKLVEERSLSESEGTRTINMDRPDTEEGTILGTASYMSPEQAEGRRVDARSDIFSFGALLYEMLTGRRAFPGDSQMSILAAILRSEPPPLERHGEGIPRELIRLVQRCLRKDLDRRAHSMRDLKLALEELKEDSDSGIGAVAAVPPPPPRRTWLLAAAAIGLLAIAGATFWYRTRVGPVAPPLKAVPLTTMAGVEFYPSLSPDGNQVAFMWVGEKADNADIYVQLIGSGKPLRITTDPAPDTFPAWSPDGRWIAFLRVGNGPKGLFARLLLVPALGGAERELADVGYLSSYGPTQISWSPDSRNLVFAKVEPEQGSALFSVSLETGATRPITAFSKKEKGRYAHVAASPDGTSLAFFRWRTSGSQVGELFVQPVTPELTSRGTEKMLFSDTSGVSGIAWTSDSRDIVFSSGGDGTPGLRRVSASGVGPARPMEVGENVSGPASISARTPRLVYSQNIVPDLNIWRLNLSDPAAPSERVLSSTRMEIEAHYSPDGKKIAFKSNRLGSNQVWVSEADGSNAVQITHENEACSPTWSPDGREIAFNGMVEGQWQIMAIPSGGGQSRRITNMPVSAVRPSWSRDGQWIYFSSGAGLWKVKREGGSAARLGTLTGTNPVESLDGTAIYYARSGAIWKAASDGSGEARLTDGLEMIEPAQDGLYFMSPRPQRGLWFYRFATKESRIVLQLEKQTSLGLSLSPDGKSLIYSQYDTAGGGDLMLVDNFR